MGLEVSDKEVSWAIKELYPLGHADEDTGIVIRELFRYLKESL